MAFTERQKKVVGLMDGLGFRESQAGTADIRRAVDLMMERPGGLMHKDIYPALAGADRQAIARVERRIRGAITTAMQSPNWDEAWRDLGGWGKPTNSELVRRLAREAANED